jgi:cytidine deaminase
VTNEELMVFAEKVMEKSYSPYSKFKVGAALLGCDDKVYTGTNIENVSFGMTVCAERNAVFSAVGQGEKCFKKLALVTEADTIVTPCGACLQVLKEFADDLEVTIKWKNGIKTVTLKELLPMAFEYDLKEGN